MSDDWRHIAIPVNRILERLEAPRIAAIPTEYAGVVFRSRLEARWAAYFDLSGVKWHYEPIDFCGWIPDFLLQPEVRGTAVDVYTEVKPAFEPDPTAGCYAKAVSHSPHMWVLLLGATPMDWRIGYLCDEPDRLDDQAPYGTDVLGALSGYDLSTWKMIADQVSLWREAGNLTQFRPPQKAISR